MTSDNAAFPANDHVVKVPVVEEQLSVATHAIDTGRGVRVHKTVHAHPVTVDETLTHDEMDVRHVLVDRMLEDGETMPTTRYEGEVLIVPVLEEVLVVERRVRLKEELHITRMCREESHTETVMLKVEQVTVERFDESGNPPT
jgi:stress response protein YsnF